ncbi:hypothetical protein E1295_21375 [Nonomuraea mesophila]|uniref:DUF5666 domain-containing protein n=1 Tax=Nonomuraea mesophila TaxID=2530382 RepID=A0A4R5FE78_9ACTN|nr:DUF5666 domain-containing protein [Nonomuraea mesophila]TDE48424.1 hypothetical protein E1295_21375 [Nonomuraea mesophila]
MKHLVAVAAAAVLVAGFGSAAYAAAPSVTSSPAFSEGPPRWGEVLYGETVTRDDDGRTTVRNHQRGRITKVSGTSMTVRSADGTSWTWVLNGDTEVRTEGKDDASDLKAGDDVMVAGTREGGTRTASFVTNPLQDLGELRDRLKDLRQGGWHHPRGLGRPAFRS